MRSLIQVLYGELMDGFATPKKAIIHLHHLNGYFPQDFFCFSGGPAVKREVGLMEKGIVIAKALNDDDHFLEMVSLEHESRIGVIDPPENLHQPIDPTWSEEDAQRVFPELLFEAAGLNRIGGR